MVLTHPSTLHGHKYLIYTCTHARTHTTCCGYGDILVLINGCGKSILNPFQEDVSELTDIFLLGASTSMSEHGAQDLDR